MSLANGEPNYRHGLKWSCLLYTSDAADERSSVDLGGRRIIKKKKNTETGRCKSKQKNTKKESTTRNRRVEKENEESDNEKG